MNSNGSYVGKIVGIPTVDLSDPKIETNNFIVKKDGSILANVRYADMVYDNPSGKFGDVDSALFIAVTRDGGQQHGINIMMGTLSNDQKMAKFEVEASSPVDSITLSYRARNLEIHCQTPKN
jgi:hypothetical protein